MALQVLLGAAVLVGVVLTLVAVLLWFERRFIPSGPFRIAFADERERPLEVSAAGTLLTALRVLVLFEQILQ